MEPGLRINVAPDATHGMVSCRLDRLERRSAADRISASLSRYEDLTAVEGDKLLEDVRMALDRDLGNATGMAERLAALLASKLSRDPYPALTRGGLASWQKRKVQSYIVERLEGALLVRDLAQLVSLSAGYFSRAFKQSFGETPHSYIVKARIERAQQLILTTSESLSQIALACGLVDQAHLCRTFRQVTGTTPGAWRRSHAAGPAPGGMARSQRNHIGDTAFVHGESAYRPA
jgi:AraC family transcriptional regulator